MKNNNIAYYKSIGLTDAQANVLGCVTYNNYLLALALDCYNKSDDKNKNISFCESLNNFSDNSEITDSILSKYIEKNGGPSVDMNPFGNVYGQQFSKAKNTAFNFGSRGLGAQQMVNSNASVCVDSISNNVYFEKECCYSCGILPEKDTKINIEDIRYDKYEHIDEKGFRNTLVNPTSTFRTTCNNASFDIIKANLNRGYKIDKSMVRIEELLNYFNYELDKPNKEKFGIETKLFNKPLSNNKMLYVGVQGKDIIPQRQNIVILLDISGSMSGEEEHVQSAIITIASKLSTGDKLSLVTYSSKDSIDIKDITINESSMDYIIEKVLAIKIFGCTYGSKGLNTAYELISKNMIKDGINRVVIITDGDFNFGDCSTDSIEKLILDKKKTGAYISVIGTGLINTNDELMNTLAKNGNGNYCYIKSIDDVKENIYRHYNKIMFTIAKDVKAQIEFNPKYVESYRLIGYENRELNHDDFKNDSIIAEPYGCGAQCNAIYEIVIKNCNNEENGLRYQNTIIKESDELCTVSIRYKDIESDTIKQVDKSIKYKVDKLNTNTKLAYLIYIIGEKLRNSTYINNNDIDFAKKIINELKDDTNNKNKIDLLESMLDS